MNGRSKVGTWCRILITGSKGESIHQIGCIFSYGFRCFEIQEGINTDETSQQWMRRCLDKIKEHTDEGVVVVIDNAPCHHGIEIVFDEEAYRHHELVRLAPYSSIINPIEHVWSWLKSYVKIQMNENREDLLRRDRMDGWSMLGRRKEMLRRFMLEATDRLDNQLIINFQPCSCILWRFYGRK